MHRHLTTAVLAMAALVSAGAPASASGDSCEPGLSLDFASRPPCSNVSAMVPGNDTRANLMLLLADLHGTRPSPTAGPRPTLDWPEFRDRLDGSLADPDPAGYAAGQGSRCRSDEAGARDFDAAVAAAPGLSPDERAALSRARGAARFTCPSGDAPAASRDPAPPGMAGPGARAFAAYLRAADAFYGGRFSEASAGFAALVGAPDPWVSETADYMVARTAVNALQVGAYDEYGSFKGASEVDQGKADDARGRLDGYLARHPKGRYAVSARGLLRRVDWLAGRTDALAASYAALIAQPPAARGLSDAALAEEIDNKLLPVLKAESTRDPTLLAVIDLMAMRGPDPGKARTTRPDLAAQRDAFASNPELLAFLEASLAQYVDGDPKAVIRGIPDDARHRDGNHLWFARQFLRGTALDAAGDRNARGFWKELAGAATRPSDRLAVELAFALNVERRGDIADAFVPGSPLTEPAMRIVLLEHDAGPALLRARATGAGVAEGERRAAVRTLLRKDLVHGAYADFLSDLAAVPADVPRDADGIGPFVGADAAGEIGCPTVGVTAESLARDGRATRPRLCLAEWMRLADPGAGADKVAKGTLGAGPSRFPGAEASPSQIYASVAADGGAPADDRAYALYRAVRCYEPSGFNHCAGPDVPKAQRGRWYDQLRRDHPGSRWARSLRYWW